MNREQAEIFKTQGNEAFKNNNFQKAKDFYSKAICIFIIVYKYF